MARYRGPKTKIARKFGQPIFGEDKNLDKKKFRGDGFKRKFRTKKTEYALQLQEKQKAKYIYGILERQFRNMFEKASRAKGITGHVLLQMAESRLDNVVYRLGLAPSRAAARQLVSHKHIVVNGEIVNIPSFQLSAGDEITIREKSKSLGVISESLDNRKDYEWLIWNHDTKTGTFNNTPERIQIPEDIKEQLIVELYSK